MSPPPIQRTPVARHQPVLFYASPRLRAAGWREAHNESGKPYYRNDHEQMSRRDNPRATQASKPHHSHAGTGSGTNNRSGNRSSAGRNEIDPDRRSGTTGPRCDSLADRSSSSQVGNCDVGRTERVKGQRVREPGSPVPDGTEESNIPCRSSKRQRDRQIEKHQAKKTFSASEPFSLLQCEGVTLRCLPGVGYTYGLDLCVAVPVCPRFSASGAGRGKPAARQEREGVLSQRPREDDKTPETLWYPRAPISSRWGSFLAVV